MTGHTHVPDPSDDGATEPVIREYDGHHLPPSRPDDDPFADYDPERVREGLRLFAGTISPEEGERMKALVYRGREEGTRPPGRPRATRSTPTD